jgi:hypothetical protein
MNQESTTIDGRLVFTGRFESLQGAIHRACLPVGASGFPTTLGDDVQLDVSKNSPRGKIMLMMTMLWTVPR